MQSQETRIAVLEQITESHERRITDIEEFHRDVVDRLDQKIHLDASNQIVLERTLAKAVTSLDSLNETVRTVGKNADDANRLVQKHETIGATILKGGGALALVISGLWAVFTFFFSK